MKLTVTSLLLLFAMFCNGQTTRYYNFRQPAAGVPVIATQLTDFPGQARDGAAGDTMNINDTTRFILMAGIYYDPTPPSIALYDVWMYTSQTDRWDSISELPFTLGVSQMVARTINNKLYVFEMTTDSLWSMDENFTWVLESTNADFMIDRGSANYCVIDGKVTVIGGYTHPSTFFNDAWEFDVNTMTQTELLDPLPFDSLVFSTQLMSSLNGEFGIFGGGWISPANDLRNYHTTTDAVNYTDKGESPLRKMWSSMATLNDTIMFLCCGYSHVIGANSKEWWYTYDLDNWSYLHIPDFIPLHAGKMFELNGAVYFVTGQGEVGGNPFFTNDFWKITLTQ